MSLKKEDLIIGEIYYFTIGRSEFIVKWTGKNIGTNVKVTDKGHFFTNGHFSGEVNFIKKATSDERQWLEVCIENNKFITKEEALEIKQENYKVGDIINCDSFGDENCEISKIEGDKFWIYYPVGTKDFKDYQSYNFSTVKKLKLIKSSKMDNDIDRLLKEKEMKLELNREDFDYTKVYKKSFVDKIVNYKEDDSMTTTISQLKKRSKTVCFKSNIIRFN